MNPTQSIALRSDVVRPGHRRAPATARAFQRVDHADQQRLNLLSVSTADYGGGAEKIGSNLFEAFASRGHGSWLAVGHKRREEENVYAIGGDQSSRPWADFWWKLHNGLEGSRGRFPGVGRVRHAARTLATFPASLGLEAMDFPASHSLLDLIPEMPDLVHCHNLHGGYFDLRAMAPLSRTVPVVLTLHDMWMLTGHCAYTLGCDRWKGGCGSCPDLSIYPAIARDATSYNWKRKRKIYRESRLYVATPSQWLMKNVEESMLMEGIVEARVINNGVNRRHFHPGDRIVSRATLGIPSDAPVLLFAANGVRRNMFKDYQTLHCAVERIAQHQGNERIIFIALGEESENEQLGNVEIRYVPYRQDAEEVARYYQAADLYLHAARDDNFPNTVLEALSCGTPVVATAVGGIPEQIRGLYGCRGGMKELNSIPIEDATGVLVGPGDSEGMAEAVLDLLSDRECLDRLSSNAARDAARRFDMERQVDLYLEWFQQICDEVTMGS